MVLQLYSKAGTHKTDLPIGSSDRRIMHLQGDHHLSISCTLAECTLIEPGDYVLYDGEHYIALEPYAPEQRSSIEYAYSLTLSHSSAVMRQIMVHKPASKTIELEFAYYATPAEHIKLIVDNLNRGSGYTDWSVGTILDAPARNIDYRRLYCADALAEIARLYKTEYWIEGRTINLSRCEHGEPIALAYMQGHRGISRSANSTASYYTRLYPVGSSRNIDPAKYGRNRLSMPEGRAYLEHNTHLGIIEHSEEAALAHIYPRYTGRVSSVRHEERTAEGKSYRVYYIEDNDLPYNPNTHEIAGLTKRISFVSGELNGQDFEANYHSSSGEWELITQHPYEGVSIPSGHIIPRTGDQYIPYNIRMPEEYIRRAEVELETETRRLLETLSTDTSIYKMRTDYIDLANRSVRLKLGQRVSLEDEHLWGQGGKHISRIISISHSLLLPTEAELECSHAVTQGRVAKMESNIAQLQASMAQASETLPAILKSWDSTDVSEYNVLSALRTIHTIRQIALRKDADDYTAHNLGSKDYVPGLGGWLIDKLGNASFSSLKVFGALEVDELRRNRITIVEGEHYFSSGTAVVSEVGDNSIVPALEDGDSTSLVVGDYCIGKWTVAPGQVEVCKLMVTRIDAGGRIHYSLATGSPHPRVGMHLAQIGHASNPRRQRGTCVRNNVIIQYSGVRGWEIRPEHITALLGDLEGYSQPPFGRLEGSGVYLSNAYITGRLSVRSDDGSTQRVPYERGAWVAGTTAQPYDLYTHNGHYWLWEGLGATKSTPSTEAGWTDRGPTAEALRGEIRASALSVEYSEDGRTGWHEGGKATDRYLRQRVGEDGVWSEAIRIAGEDAIMVELWSKNGTDYKNSPVDTEVVAFVHVGRREVGRELPTNAFHWTRYSNNPDTDRVFNSAHDGVGSTITIRPQDGWYDTRLICMVEIPEEIVYRRY